MAERVWDDAFQERPPATPFLFEEPPPPLEPGIPASKSAFATLRAR
jgi:hypothetical protein